MGDDLEAEALAAPFDAPVFAVWADAMIERGDPRGELVSLSRRLRADPADSAAAGALRRLVEANAEAWCPGCLDDTIALGWRDGFVDTLTFRPGYEESGWDYGYNGKDEDEDEERSGPAVGRAVRELLDRPLGARIRSISSCCPLYAEGNHGCWGSHEGFVEALLSQERPHLRALELDPDALPRGLSHGASVPELSFLQLGFMHDAEIAVGDLGELWRVAPGLEHLVLGQPHDANLGNIDAPALQTLVFGSSSPKNLDRIARGRLPSLRTLAIRVSSGESVERILGSATIGRIAHLGLAVTPGEPDRPSPGDAVLRALLRSSRLGHLETLDLSGLDASDEAWGELLAAADRFRSLRELRLTSWTIDPEETFEDWLDGLPELLALPRMSPGAREIGARLTAALPVRWMRAWYVSFEARDRAPTEEEGLFSGMWLGDEGFFEQRA